MAGILHLSLIEVPGRMQAERVLIAASACHLRFPSKPVAHTHLKLEFPEQLRVVITDADICAPQVDELMLSRKHSMDSRPLSVQVLRNALLANGNKLSVTSRLAMCQPEGNKEHRSYGWCCGRRFARLSMGLGP